MPCESGLHMKGYQEGGQEAIRREVKRLSGGKSRGYQEGLSGGKSRGLTPMHYQENQQKLLKDKSWVNRIYWKDGVEIGSSYGLSTFLEQETYYNVCGSTFWIPFVMPLTTVHGYVDNSGCACDIIIIRHFQHNSTYFCICFAMLRGNK